MANKIEIMEIEIKLTCRTKLKFDIETSYHQLEILESTIKSVK